MKSRIASILLAASAGFVTLHAQTRDGNHLGPGPEVAPIVAPTPPIRPSDEVVALRTEIHALRTELEASRRATIEGLGVTPDRAAVIAALAEWRQLNAETIAEVEALAAELRDMMANLRPDGTPVRPIPDEIADQRAALIELRTDLAKSRAAVIAELGPDATAEDICMALAEWHVVNESTIAAMRELSQDLAEWMRSNRPVRPERPEVSAEIQERREALQADAQALRRERQQLRQEMANATPEEREAMIRAFQEQQRELMQERRELRRLERLGGREVGGDPRRGG